MSRIAASTFNIDSNRGDSAALVV